MHLQLIQDIDECLKEPCQAGKVCHNVNGTFNCLCHEGFFEYEEEEGCVGENYFNLFLIYEMKLYI